MDVSLLSLSTPMVKTGKIRCCQGLDKIGGHVVAMSYPHNTFLLYFLSTNGSFVLERELCMSKNINILFMFSQLFIG